MQKLLSTFILVIAFSTLSFGQQDKMYYETLKTMFDVSGAEGTYQSALTQMFSIFKQQYAEVDEGMWVELEAEFQNAAMDDLIEMLVPIYEKHLTIDDLKGIIAFYETPVGKKYAAQTPIITTEAMQAGQEWGMKIGADFMEKMKARGY